jgi:DNA-directed RNA polymerase specialized sigma24 family protein
MPYHHGLERKKFEAHQRILHLEYQQAGMNEDDILAMYQFDHAEFLSNRRYREHIQALLEESMLDVAPPDGFSRYAWVDELDDPMLCKVAKALTQEDLELLTLYAFDAFSQAEIADFLGVNQSTVSRRLKHICESFSKRA